MLGEVSGAFRNFQDKLFMLVVWATYLFPAMNNHQAANENGLGICFLEPKIWLEP